MERVTSQQLLRLTDYYAQRHSAAFARTQSEISSGLRIQRPSDDPRGQYTALDRRAAVRAFESGVANIEESRTRLNIANQALRDSQEVVSRIRVLTLEARQETDSGAVEVIAREIDGLMNDLLLLANSTHQGDSLFAGAATETAAFVRNADGTVTYQGSGLPGRVKLAGGGQEDILYSGRSVFQTQGRGETLVVGSTGAAAGAGTSSAVGTRELIVRNTGTSFAAGSGVQSGTGAAADTIIGPAGAHTLYIDDTSGTGASGTISLNGGDPVAFTSGDTNLVVTGPMGEAVHLDATAITAGFQGTVSITADGAMSVDGGAAETAIDFSANQSLVDSRDGSVVQIDSQGIRGTGTDHVEFTGTGDVFQVLDQLQKDLRNTAGLSLADRDAALGRRLDDLQRLSDHMLDVVGEQSVTLQHFDSLQNRAEALNLEAKTVLADTESTDYAEAILRLQNEQLLVQYSLASTARLFDTSLLNFLA
jgi:flagellar hook-associated protein 3